MIIASTTSPGEAREMTDLFRTAPPWLDWKVFEMGALVASSADLRTWTDPDRVIRQDVR